MDGNFSKEIWVRFWAYKSLFGTKMTKLIWQRYKNLFNIILVRYGSKGTKWAVQNRIKSRFMVAFVTFYKINSKQANSFMYKKKEALIVLRLMEFCFYEKKCVLQQQSFLKIILKSEIIVVSFFLLKKLFSG